MYALITPGDEPIKFKTNFEFPQKQKQGRLTYFFVLLKHVHYSGNGSCSEHFLSRKAVHEPDRLVQSVEHQTFNLRVMGSSPISGDFLFYNISR